MSQSHSLIEGRDRARKLYGSAIGSERKELVTPSLILDLEVVRENLAFMAKRLKSLPLSLRAHIMVHKSPDIARMQVEAGA